MHVVNGVSKQPRVVSEARSYRAMLTDVHPCEEPPASDTKQANPNIVASQNRVYKAGLHAQPWGRPIERRTMSPSSLPTLIRISRSCSSGSRHAIVEGCAPSCCKRSISPPSVQTGTLSYAFEVAAQLGLNGPCPPCNVNPFHAAMCITPCNVMHEKKTIAPSSNTNVNSVGCKSVERGCGGGNVLQESGSRSARYLTTGLVPEAGSLKNHVCRAQSRIIHQSCGAGFISGVCSCPGCNRLLQVVGSHSQGISGLHQEGIPCTRQVATVSLCIL